MVAVYRAYNLHLLAVYRAYTLDLTRLLFISENTAADSVRITSTHAVILSHWKFLVTGVVSKYVQF